MRDLMKTHNNSIIKHKEQIFKENCHVHYYFKLNEQSVKVETKKFNFYYNRSVCGLFTATQLTSLMSYLQLVHRFKVVCFGKPVNIVMNLLY